MAVGRHQPKRAIQLYARAARVREEKRPLADQEQINRDRVREGKRPSADQEDVDQDIATIREMIDQATFDAAYAVGQAMTIEEAIVCALQGSVDKA